MAAFGGMKEARNIPGNLGGLTTGENILGIGAQSGAYYDVLNNGGVFNR